MHRVRVTITEFGWLKLQELIPALLNKSGISITNFQYLLQNFVALKQKLNQTKKAIESKTTKV